MLGQQVVERRTGHPEQLGGAREVAAGDGERLSDRLRLGALARDPQVEILRVIARILQSQIARRHHRTLRHDDRALDAVLQLAHVARPAVRLDGADGIGRESARGLAEPLGHLLQQELREQQAVALPIAQRRHADGHLADAIEQVIAEMRRCRSASSRLRLVAQTMRRSSGIGVRPPMRSTVRSCSTRSIFACSDAGISPISSRNTVPPSAASSLPGVRLAAPGEGALLIAEQLALQQVSGMAAQLMATNGLCERPESRCTARASSSLPVPLSPSSSTVALVGATFSIARHRLRMESLTPMMPSSAIAPVLLAQPPVLLLELANPERAAHDDGEHAGIQRLVIEIRRAEAHGRDRQLARIVLGHGDDLGVGREIQDLPQQLQALRRHRRLAGGAQVEQHDVGLETPHEGERLLGGLGRGDVQIGEDLLELAPQPAIILQDQKLAPLHLRSRQQLLCHACSRFP